MQKEIYLKFLEFLSLQLPQKRFFSVIDYKKVIRKFGWRNLLVGKKGRSEILRAGKLKFFAPSPSLALDGLGGPRSCRDMTYQVVHSLIHSFWRLI